VGRFLGRIHGVGRAARFRHRKQLSLEELGRDARDFVLDGDWMPDYLAAKYADLTDTLLEEVERQASGWGGARLGRILGDCHRGNILWTDLGPHFVDLDDCLTGPAIQDIWMLLAGSQQEMRTELSDLLKGYEQFLPFDRGEMALIEPLRALRMIHYSAWLARRWDDPAFPRAFPWFAEPRYWEEHYRALEDQLVAVLGPRLEL
jgi:Ser/Thr protein kinase RdoA (MazF antagonist)